MKRYSIIVDDLTKCAECQNKGKMNLHEVFFGRNRQNSIKYGLVIPLCQKEHHNQIECKGIHFDKELCDKWHKIGQEVFEKTYPELNFISIFRRNYKDV